MGPLQEAFDAEEVRFRRVRIHIVEEGDDLEDSDQVAVEVPVEDIGGVAIAFEGVRQRP